LLPLPFFRISNRKRVATDPSAAQVA